MRSTRNYSRKRRVLRKSSRRVSRKSLRGGSGQDKQEWEIRDFLKSTITVSYGEELFLTLMAADIFEVYKRSANKIMFENVISKKNGAIGYYWIRKEPGSNTWTLNSMINKGNSMYDGKNPHNIEVGHALSAILALNYLDELKSGFTNELVNYLYPEPTASPAPATTTTTDARPDFTDDVWALAGIDAV